MKTKFLLLFMLFILILKNSFSQNDECKSVIKEGFFDKIKNHNPMDLIPYNIMNEDGYTWPPKWGLMDKNTKIKVTEPLMHRAATFNPNLSFIYHCNKGFEVKITSDFELTIRDFFPDIWEYYDNSNFDILDSINGYRGFKVDDNGKLIAFSKAYFIDKRQKNISNPFRYNNEYYAIVNSENGNSIIINTEGEAKKGFSYKRISYTDIVFKDEQIFYIVDFQDEKAFITLSGNKYLFGELLNFPVNHNNHFGYSIQQYVNNTNNVVTTGILDLITMEWLITPTMGLNITDICFTSEKDIQTDYRNRDNANIYFIVLEDNLRYLIDIKGEKYKLD